jgi:hypothetical protein
MLCGLLLLAPAGCQPALREPPAEMPAFTVQLDDRRPAAPPLPAAAGQPTIPRALSFEMVGFAGQPSADGSVEQRAAVTQAAVIEAFYRALAEARRSRGQSSSDFTAELGPRLTLSHCRQDGADEIRISLVRRGAETVFEVRGGVLQHPPHDLDLLRQVFEETRGEFSLLSADWNPARGGCEARVACYLPAGLDKAVAGAPSVEGDAP